MTKKDKKIYLASYKGTRPGLAGVFNRLIRFFDKSSYSHSELTVGNPFTSEVDCYSSSISEGGVRVKKMKLNKERWTIQHVSWVTEEDVKEAYERTKGMGYDYVGALSVKVSLLKQIKNRFFCNEWCGKVMGIDQPWRYSPGGLFRITDSFIRILEFRILEK